MRKVYNFCILSDDYCSLACYMVHVYTVFSPSGYMKLSDGDQIEVEPSPGSMGQMDGTQGCGGGGGGGGEDGGNFKKEQPSLEEAFKLETQKVCF